MRSTLEVLRVNLSAVLVNAGVRPDNSFIDWAWSTAVEIHDAVPNEAVQRWREKNQ
jgi:hypothetical protein